MIEDYSCAFKLSRRKLLRRLAGQIVRDIRPDIVYRNIPFGCSQLDIHSDGEIVILAVKTLSAHGASLIVREFQVPKYKLYNLLLSSKVTKPFNKNNMGAIVRDRHLAKQISQGIAQFVYQSRRSQEVWFFPFYGDTFAFEKTGSFIDPFTKLGKIEGNVILPHSYSSTSIPVSGIVNVYNDDEYRNIAASLDFKIYRALGLKRHWATTYPLYSEINSNIPIKAA